MKQSERRARQRRDEHAGPEPGAYVNDEPARERARDHDAFDAEIQHARALAKEDAERAEHERRRDAQHRDPEIGVLQDLHYFQRRR